jgi:hypothetical protein
MADLQGNIPASEAEHREHQSPLFAKRVTDVGSDVQKRIDYGSGTNPLYVGYGAKGLASSVTGWLISAITYDANSNPTLIQSAVGIWDNRDSLAYS